MSEGSDRLGQYADVDTLAISLWPLVKAYTWTYRDLLNVIRRGLKRAIAYACGAEQILWLRTVWTFWVGKLLKV